MKKILYTIIAMIGFANVSLAQGYYYIKTLGTTSEYNFNPISSTAILTGVTGGLSSTLSSAQTLPFAWSFYGSPVTTFKASSSGYITFDTTQTLDKATNTNLPNITAPKKAIFAFWDSLKLEPITTFPSDVKTWTYGSSPNRVFVVQWRLASVIGTTASITNFTYFAIRIYEPGGFDIVENYGSGSFSATIGCQNATGTLGTNVTGSPTLNFGGNNGNYLASASDVYTFYYGTQPSIWARSVSNQTSLNASTNISAGTPISVKYTNWGSTAINSANLKYNINNGSTVTQSITQTIASNGGFAILSTTTTANYQPAVSDEGTIKTIKVWLSNINGTTNTSDTLTFTIFVNKGISGTKRVLLEEGSGGWCGYCPDGHLKMSDIVAANNKVVAVVHHNIDGMANTQSNTINSAYATGYPYGVVDRTLFSGQTTVSLNRNLWDAKVTEALAINSPANISIINKTYNTSTRVIDYDVKVDFVDFALPGNIKLNTLIVEDNVRGPMISSTNTTWNQRNYYSSAGSASGGSTHPFYNYPEYLYGYLHNNVVRNIPTGAWGNAYSIPTNPVAGSSYTQHFSYTLPTLVSVTDADFTGQNNIINQYQNTYAGPAQNKPNNIKLVAFLSYDSQIINSNQTYLLPQNNYTVSDTIVCKGKEVTFDLGSNKLYNGNTFIGSWSFKKQIDSTMHFQLKSFDGITIANINITVNDSLTIQPITSSDTLSYCGYNSKFVIGVNTSNTSPKNYLWYKNDTLLLVGKTLAIDTFTSAGKYKVTLNTSTGCYQERTFTINKFNNTFNPDFASNKQNATTTPFDFTFSNNTTPMSDYNFTWSWGDGNTAQNNNLINFYTYTNNGTYSVKLVAQNKVTGCKDSIVKANYITCSGGTSGVLAMNTNKINPICYGESNGSITLNTTGGTTPYQYKINNGSYQSTNSFTNLSAGIYTVYVKDATNATVSKTDTLINPNLLAVGGILGSNGVPVSSTQNYNIASQNGVIYTWNIINGTLLSGNGTNSIQVQWAAVAGMGKVIANIVKNSCSAADTLVVSIGSNPLTLSTIKTDETCAGKANGAITINAVGGTSPYQYAMNNGTYQTGNTFNNLVAGIYVSKVKDASNVISQKTDTINAGVGITVGVINGINLVKPFDLINYVISQQIGATYIWNVSGGNIASGQGTNIAQVSWGATAGTGLIKVKVNSAVGCIDSTQLNVTIGSTNISSASPIVNALKVYPNPASTILHIDLEKPGYYTAKLSSVSGQSIISPTTGTVDISALANGVYILSIYDSNNKLISTNKVAILK